VKPIVAILTLGAIALPLPADAQRRQRPREAARSDVYYANCSEARAAGAAPIRRGQPGYRPALDRDNDGIACER
jgi:hypothetical protein